MEGPLCSPSETPGLTRVRGGRRHPSRPHGRKALLPAKIAPALSASLEPAGCTTRPAPFWVGGVGEDASEGEPSSDQWRGLRLPGTPCADQAELNKTRPIVRVRGRRIGPRIRRLG